MEFNEKLQELRKKRKLTQDELAEMLFVSRTAVSKWESGRGYPNIDSLKRIAKLFSVTVDELLSGDALLNIAEEETKQKESCLRDLVFGLSDLGLSLLLFLPLFAQRTGNSIQQVSLLTLSTVSGWLKILFLAMVAVATILGVLTLAMQGNQSLLWLRIKSKLSIIVNMLGVLVFTISLQPYPAIFTFIFLIIKFFLLAKKQ